MFELFSYSNAFVCYECLFASGVRNGTNSSVLSHFMAFFVVSLISVKIIGFAISCWVEWSLSFVKICIFKNASLCQVFADRVTYMIVLLRKLQQETFSVVIKAANAGNLSQMWQIIIVPKALWETKHYSMFTCVESLLPN